MKQISLLKKLKDFYKVSSASPDYQGNEEARKKYYNKLRWSSFLAATIDYSLYYVCRTSLNVVKKPILESGVLDAKQLGIIGSTLLFTYAIGKFVNSFLADHSNIKRFMATGLIVSTLANLCNGHDVYDFTPVSYFWIGASVMSFVFATFVWNAKVEQ